ncbi:hypothetical protein Q5P01_005327 [Channa striata]|uniref:Uncharacterized protein n=1 Tax=Channa striata TaxID=64152 RepID=A0AA88NDL2_CHASR|nr:hypothetical protein Q5P01_005327 [Channa striata]
MRPLCRAAALRSSFSAASRVHGGRAHRQASARALPTAPPLDHTCPAPLAGSIFQTTKEDFSPITAV